MAKKSKGISVYTKLGTFVVKMGKSEKEKAIRNSLTITKVPDLNDVVHHQFDDAIVRPYVLTLLLHDLKTGHAKIEDL